MIAQERLQLAQKTFCNLESTLCKIKKKEYSVELDEMQDAAIKRFTLAFDTFWKFLHAYMQEVEKINIQGIASPRSTFCYALQSGKITDTEYKQCISMIDDRKLFARFEKTIV